MVVMLYVVTNLFYKNLYDTIVWKLVPIGEVVKELKIRSLLAYFITTTEFFLLKRVC